MKEKKMVTEGCAELKTSGVFSSFATGIFFNSFVHYNFPK